MPNIPQIDGLGNSDSICSSEDDLTSEDSIATSYNTEDEIDPETGPISITPPTKLNKRKRKILEASSLPLVAVLNARSLYNKSDNFKTLLSELGIEVSIISETWEREEQLLESLLQMTKS